jgi:hypothetical protein
MISACWQFAPGAADVASFARFFVHFEMRVSPAGRARSTPGKAGVANRDLRAGPGQLFDDQR